MACQTRIEGLTVFDLFTDRAWEKAKHNLWGRGASQTYVVGSGVIQFVKLWTHYMLLLYLCYFLCIGIYGDLTNLCRKVLGSNVF